MIQVLAFTGRFSYNLAYMTFSRTHLIAGIVAVVALLAIGYGAFLQFGPSAKYRGLNTYLDIQLDEASRTYFANRLATEQAAIAALEAKGEEVDLDLVLSAASDAYATGDLVLARQYVERQLKSNALNYGAWNFYGTVLEGMGDYDGARTAFAKAMNSGASMEEYYRDYVTLIQNHYPTEQAEVKRVLELDVADKGQNSWNMVELGHWYQKNGDCQSAIEHFKVAQTLAPGNTSIGDELKAVEATCR